jgi:hypothetical protein
MGSGSSGMCPGGSGMDSGSFGLSSRGSGMCCGGSVLGLDTPACAPTTRHQCPCSADRIAG